MNSADATAEALVAVLEGRMNVFCSWCNDPISWAGIEYGVSHSICRRCCWEHFPVAAVSLIIKAMENKKEK